MADKKWKKQERRVAEFFGTKRVPLSGSNSGHNTSSDSLHERLYIECKYRKRIPIFDLWPDIYKKALKENKIPVLAVKSMQIADDIICIRKKDLDKLLIERLRAFNSSDGIEFVISEGTSLEEALKLFGMITTDRNAEEVE